MTCKDCLHYEVCVIIEHSVSTDEDYLTEFGCDDFKDRTKWVEQKHGRWIFGNTLGHAWMKCSECLKSQIPNGCFTYCPNCGAKMEDK